MGSGSAAPRRVRPAAEGRLNAAGGPSRPWLIDLGITVAVGLLALRRVLYGPHPVTAAVLSAALVIPLLWRRRAPVVVFAVLAAVFLVQWAFGFALSADIALLVALFTVAAYRPRRIALVAAAVVEAGVLLAAFRFGLAGDAPASVFFLTGLAAAAFFIGINVQTRRDYLQALVDRAAVLERERDQQALLSATAERSRIARELHDIVAHSLTVVVTMAEAAAVMNHTDRDRASGIMTQVAATGRDALGEMRRLLDLLRVDQDGTASLSGEGSAIAPSPGLDRVDQLVGAARAAGLPVRLTVVGAVQPLPSPVDATAFRVLQESLTNAMRHAVEPTNVNVLVKWKADAVELQVDDDGRTVLAADPSLPRGTGHGLAGMRERLALFGGSLTTGPRTSGGWSVTATLPIPGQLE